MLKTQETSFTAGGDGAAGQATKETPDRRYGAVVWPGAIYDENLLTWANGITAFRTVACLVMFAYALLANSYEWNLAGLAVYWSLDILDGYIARVLDQETLFGAQFDILTDRFLISFFYLNYLSFRPELTYVVALFLLQFITLDQYLSNQYLRWPVRSPNYFFVVDKLVWQLNWSRVGKFGNTGLVTVLLLFTDSPWFLLPVIILLFGVKIYSIVRLHRLVPAAT